MPDLEGLDLGSSDDEAGQGANTLDECISLHLNEAELRHRDP